MACLEPLFVLQHSFFIGCLLRFLNLVLQSLPDELCGVRISILVPMVTGVQ